MRVTFCFHAVLPLINCQCLVSATDIRLTVSQLVVEGSVTAPPLVSVDKNFDLGH